MTQPNPSQIKEFEKQTQYNENTELRFSRERFVREFLTLAGGVAYGKSGSGTSRGWGMYYENYGTSNAVPIATTEGSPQMGAQITGYFSEFSSRRNLLFKEKTIMREVTGATVYIGALATTQWGVNVHGPEKILQVFNNPRVVFYRPEAADQLQAIEPGDVVWDEMLGLAEQLHSQKEALDNGQAQPIGWLS